jgi:hypothetical protein
VTPDPEDAARSVDAAEVEHFGERRAEILDRISRACARAGRDPADVELVAVSKTVPASRLAAAVDAGFRTLGENRVQEAAGKAPLLPGVAWHLVGHLQGNKARPAIDVFDAVQSVDSIDLARRLDRVVSESSRRPLAVYLQVNVDLDPAKHGFREEELDAVVPAIADLRGLELRGLMTVGRLVASVEEARTTFASLRTLAERLRAQEPRLGPALSMGMTEDFEVAIEEGATVVRVGSAIFGERPARGS